MPLSSRLWKPGVSKTGRRCTSSRRMGPFVRHARHRDTLYPLESLADFVDLAPRRDEYVERAAEYLQEHTEPIKDDLKVS